MDLHPLNEPPHPIRRCPTDILRLIFEWVVDLEAFGQNHYSKCIWHFKISTSISHVCFRWREIALSTPRLWASSVVKLNKNPKDIREFWSRLVDRVGIYPISIIIHDNHRCNEEDLPLNSLAECRIDLLPHIYHLSFLVVEAPIGSRSLQPQDFCPPAPANIVEKLSISYVTKPEPYNEHPDDDYPQYASTPSATKDVIDHIRRFPTIHSLAIVGVDFFISVPDDTIFSNITDLEIHDAALIPTARIAQIFPNLEQVKFLGCTFQACENIPISWPSLHTLNVRASWFTMLTSDFPWRDLHVPLLKDLTSSDGTGDVLDFISSHPSIKHLDIAYWYEEYESIAQKAPQLVSLRTVPCNEICDTSKMPFPHLRELILHSFDAGIYLMTPQFFDKLVRNRFLPSADVSSGRTSNYIVTPDNSRPSLTILTHYPDTAEKFVWRKSQLMQLAREEVAFVEQCGVTYRTFKYYWDDV